MDALLFLIDEHDKVRKVLWELNETNHLYATKKEVFKNLANDLTRHETMEQTVWYTYFKDHEKLEDTVKH